VPMTEDEVTLGVVIPTLDQTRLLLELLNSLETRHPHRLFLIDNAVLGLSVAASWNRGIEAAFRWGADMALVINDDVLLHPCTVDRLVQRLQAKPCGLICAYDIRNVGLDATGLANYPVPNPGIDEGVQDFCCFLLPHQTWSRVGPFDETFTRAYYEDIDYEYRLKQHGLWLGRTTGAPCYHFGSQTGSRHAKPEDWDRNREYFRRKWGVVPGG